MSDGTAECPERDIYRLAKRMTISISPSSENLHILTVTVEGQGSDTWNLPLRPLGCPGAEFDGKYAYKSRPFAVDSFAFDRFIPLVMYGSFWIDNGFARFCGEKVLPQDMSSAMLNEMPHYYVIGITVTE